MMVKSWFLGILGLSFLTIGGILMFGWREMMSTKCNRIIKIISESNLEPGTIVNQMKGIHQRLKTASPETAEMKEITASFHDLIERVEKYNAADLKKNTGIRSMSTCPDVYHGALSDYPDYLTNWKFTDCPNKKKLAELVTVCLLLPSSVSMNNVAAMLEKLSLKHKEINIVMGTSIAVKELKSVKDKYKNLVISSISPEMSSINAWINIFKLVKTPYTFVGRSFAQFGFYTEITRSLHILDAFSDIDVVSFGNLNSNQIWNVDCYQVVLENYELNIIAGYHHSFKECTYCTYASGPFLSKTGLLLNNQLDSSLLEEEIAFLDFFIRLKNNKRNVLSCPDMMTELTTKTSGLSLPSVKNKWVPFVRKHEVNDVKLDDRERTHLKFDCVESNLVCNLHSFTGDGILIPPCCIDALQTLLKDFFQFCEQHGMHCEIDTGTVLAAVKWNSPMPWDLDLDGGFHKDNITTFLKYKHELENKGYAIQMDKTVHALNIGYKAPVHSGIKMDLWTYRPFISIGNVHTGAFKPTKTFFRDILVNAPYNPGLFARNRYGKEIFKHSPSWANFGRKTSYANYTGGEIIKCRKPGHHACMNNVIPDGNLKSLYKRW